MSLADGSRGWVLILAEVEEMRDLARELIGARLAGVRYLNLDYNGWDLGYRDDGIRTITDPKELADPTWLGDGFHGVDQEVEIETDDGRIASIGWDTPGSGESMRFRIGSQLAHFAGGALWEVSNQAPWTEFVGQTITDIVLHYHPWSDEEPGYWCTRSTLTFRDSHVEVMLGGFDSPGNGLAPAATNLAVLLNPDSLPTWELALPPIPDA